MADESLDLTLTNNNNLNGQVGLTTTNTNNNTNTETIEVKPLSQTSNQTMDLKPVKVDSSNRQEVGYDPIRTDSSSIVDVKPLTFDVCMRSGPASLPATHICEPYHHRVGLTLLGIEVVGLTWSGESQTIVDDRPHRPVVALGALTPAPAPVHVGLPTHHHGHGHRFDEPGLVIRRKHDGGGLHVRLEG